MGLKQHGRRSEDVNFKAGLRGCAWQDDPADGLVCLRARPGIDVGKLGGYDEGVDGRGAPGTRI